MTIENYEVQIDRDSVTGVARGEFWYKNGVQHRIDGPALINRDAVTGKTISSQWFLEGKVIPYRQRRNLRSLVNYVPPPSP